MLKWAWAFLLLAVASGLSALAMPTTARPILVAAMVVFTVLTVGMAVRSGKSAPKSN